MFKDELPNKPEMRDLPQQQQRVFSRSDAIKWGIAFIVSCVTFLAYLPALQNGFVNWDDNLYVYENSNIRSIDVQLLQWSLTAAVGDLWHPLTVLSLAFDYALWGLNPWGYHLTNILLHAFNAFLVFILSVRLVNYGSFNKNEAGLKTLIPGIATALLFGVHPLHVESVAWVSERKDVLCSFFFLLTLLAYFKYVSIAGYKRYLIYVSGLFFFTLALMSKPMALSLPIILLILDYYPLERLFVEGNIRKTRWVLVEKLPFFILSSLTGVLTIAIHHSVGALGTVETYPFIVRVFVAARGYLFYLFKMVLPFNLAPFYLYPSKENLFSLEYIGAFILFLTITFASVRSFKKYKIFFVIWSYYIITLLPVIGIVQVGGQSAADRYAYLPSIGPFLLIGLSIGSFFKKLSKKQYNTVALATLFLLSGILINKTITQVAIWHDSIALWSHEIKIFPGNVDKAYFNLGAAYNGVGEYLQAIKSYDIGIKLTSQDAKAYFNRGFAHDNLGNYQQAIKDYTEAIELNPLFADAFNNRGVVNNNLGNKQLAIIDLSRAVEINPQYAMAYYNLGFIYSQLGNNVLAQINYDKAADLNPGLFK